MTNSIFFLHSILSSFGGSSDLGSSYGEKSFAAASHAAATAASSPYQYYGSQSYYYGNVDYFGSAAANAAQNTFSSQVSTIKMFPSWNESTTTSSSSLFFFC